MKYTNRAQEISSKVVENLTKQDLINQDAWDIEGYLLEYPDDEKLHAIVDTALDHIDPNNNMSVYDAVLLLSASQLSNLKHAIKKHLRGGH